MRADSILSIILSVALLSSALLVYVDPASAETDSENTWRAAAPVPEALVGGRAGVVDGKIYVMDGYLSYQYDPASDTWTAKKPMPTPRILFGMAVWQDKIYVIGGGKGVDSSNQRWSLLSDAVEVYDPSTDSWQTKQPMPTARAYLQANVVNGQIYLVGGMSNKDSLKVNLNEVYNVANDSWSTATPVPYAVYSYTSAVCGDKIYIIGGQSLQAPILNLNYAQIYDCANNSWSFSAPMPTTVMFAAACATTGEASPRRVYVIGGATEGYAVLGDVQIYDPQNDKWTLGTSMPSVRHSLQLAVVNDKIYALGGDPYMAPGAAYDPIANKEWFTHNEVYTPFGYGVPDPLYVFGHTSPNVAFESSLNGTAIANSTVPLVFSVDKVVDWVGYSLDGQGNVTVAGNFTLTGLSGGEHRVVVYANDTYGNMGVSEPLTFSVELFPLAYAIIAVLAVAVAGVVLGVVVFFKKRR
jgi:hypothetical protein